MTFAASSDSPIRSMGDVFPHADVSFIEGDLK